MWRGEQVEVTEGEGLYIYYNAAKSQNLNVCLFVCSFFFLTLLCL